MIYFITDHDAATSANHLIFKNLLKENGLQLLVGQATRDRLVAGLNDHPEFPLWVMGHGKSSHFLDQNDAIAIGMDDQVFFGQRSSFVYACHTANELGLVLGREGIYWGYTGAIQAPDTRNQNSVTIFAQLFDLIIAQFPKATTEQSIQNLLAQIKSSSEEAEYKFDELFALGDDVLEAQFCLLHLWSRLRVWRGQNLLVHPDAEQSPIF
jgi:hypothetical protein